MEGVSSMWADLKQSGNLPEKSQLLWNCEAELQELMRQIDIMVQQKKSAWDRERQSLEARLEIREQEYSLQKATLDQKHGEIGKLRQQLGDMEKSQRDLVNQYENQLTKMKTEVGSMKREYEKLKKLHSKYLSREKHKVSSEMEDSLADIKRLNNKLEDYRQKGREWEQQKRAYSKQIDALESQKRTLEEKCDLIQQQTAGYQSQLDRRRDLLDSTELSLRSQITQLEGQLERARDTVNSQDTQISRLRQTLEEAVESQRKTMEEKEAFERDIRQLKNKIRHLESDLAHCQRDLEAKVEKLKQAETMQQRISQECQQMEKVLGDKEARIHALQKDDKGLQQHSQRSHALEEELRTAKEDLKKHRKQEKQLRDDIANLQHQLDTTREECSNLSSELSLKTDEMSYFEGTLIYKIRTQAAKLQDKLATVEESHAAQAQGMKAELAALTADLHQRSVAMAALNEKANAMERQLRDAMEMIDRKSAEIQVTAAQLEALRLENRHLRKVSLRSATGDLDPAEAEGQLQELQNAYVTSLSALEEQNKNLKGDLTSTRQRVRELEKRLMNVSGDSGLRSSSKDRNTSDASSENSAGEGYTQHLEGEVHQLKQLLNLREGDIHSLEQQLTRQTQTIRTPVSHSPIKMTPDPKAETLTMWLEKKRKELGLENDVMAHFVDDIDGVIQQPPRRDGSTQLNSSGHFSHVSSLENTILSDDDDLLDPVDTVTAQFLAEQQARTQELERKLDDHIESLKINTDATIKKYTS